MNDNSKGSEKNRSNRRVFNSSTRRLFFLLGAVVFSILTESNQFIKRSIAFESIATKAHDVDVSHDVTDCVFAAVKGWRADFLAFFARTNAIIKSNFTTSAYSRWIVSNSVDLLIKQPSTFRGPRFCGVNKVANPNRGTFTPFFIRVEFSRSSTTTQRPLFVAHNPRNRCMIHSKELGEISRGLTVFEAMRDLVFFDRRQFVMVPSHINSVLVENTTDRLSLNAKGFCNCGNRFDFRLVPSNDREFLFFIKNRWPASSHRRLSSATSSALLVYHNIMVMQGFVA